MRDQISLDTWRVLNQMDQALPHGRLRLASALDGLNRLILSLAGRAIGGLGFGMGGGWTAPSSRRTSQFTPDFLKSYWPYFLRISTPLIGPRHVVPANGTRICSFSKVAVPLSEIGQLSMLGLVPTAVAVQVIVLPDILPLAVPTTVMLLKHLAVNEPDPVSPLMSVTVHTKSEHVLCSDVDGATDDQVPLSA